MAGNKENTRWVGALMERSGTGKNGQPYNIQNFVVDNPYQHNADGTPNQYYQGTLIWNDTVLNMALALRGMTVIRPKDPSKKTQLKLELNNQYHVFQPLNELVERWPMTQFERQSTNGAGESFISKSLVANNPYAQNGDGTPNQYHQGFLTWHDAKTGRTFTVRGFSIVNLKDPSKPPKVTLELGNEYHVFEPIAA